MTDTIQVLTPLQQMYHRPGYILGSTDTPDTILKEMIDNASDELLNNFANRVEVTTKVKEGWYRVRDDGRGLPLSKFRTENPDMSYLNGEISTKIIFCREFSSGKYSKDNYPYSTGTNGIGTKAMNVFSTKTHIRVKDVKNLHEGKVYELILGWDKDRNQTYEENWLDPSTIEDFWWTSEVTVWPNPKVFESLSVKPRDIPLQVIKRSRPEVKITINDKDVVPFSFDKNIESNLVSDKVLTRKITYGTLHFDLSFGWCSKDFSQYYKGTVNLGTSNEGYHINVCKRAIGLALSRLDNQLKLSDAEYGLRMFVDALVYYPKYTGQTKERLSTPDDFKAHNDVVMNKYKHLIIVDANGKENINKAKDAASKDKDWQDTSGLEEKIASEVLKAFKEDEVFAEHLVARLLEYKKSINQLSDESYINSLIKMGSDKVARASVKGVIEATSPKRKDCELFLCEGRSAGSPIKNGRNRDTQALFELRGKPMNVAGADSIKDILENVEMRTVINAIGIGMYPNTRVEDARYGKIIIATDADADGLHIQGLILGALSFLCPAVFSGSDDGGSMVYIANAPLYKQGDKFIYSDADLIAKKDFKRFKGLGSMLEKDLVTTVVATKSRKLIRVSLNDARDEVLKIITSSAVKKQMMIDHELLIEVAE